MIDKIKSLLQEVEKIKAANAEELEALRINISAKREKYSDIKKIPS